VRRNVSPVKYKLGFYIKSYKDDINFPVTCRLLLKRQTVNGAVEYTGYLGVTEATHELKGTRAQYKSDSLQLTSSLKCLWLYGCNVKFLVHEF
jgi:hypothetical protein